MSPSRVPNPVLLSIRQAAAYFGVGVTMLRTAIRSGELPAFQPGKRTVFVEVASVRAWLETARVSPATARARAAKAWLAKAKGVAR